MRIQLLVACRDDHATPLSIRGMDLGDANLAITVVPMAGLLQRVAALRPDVLLIDYPPVHDHCEQLLSSITMLSPATRFLFFCKDHRPGMLLDFIRLGASGCLLWSSDAALIGRAVLGVHKGQTWFGRMELLEAVRSQLEHVVPIPVTGPHAIPHDDPTAALTGREREILALIGQALSNKEIARRLQISAATVKTHLHRIYVKLQRSGRYKAFVAQGPLAGRPAETRGAAGPSAE